METGIIKKILIAMAVLVAAVAIAYLVGRRDGQNEATRGDFVKVDTLVVHDTITQEKPIIEERLVLHKYPVFVPQTDTLWKHDTLYVWLTREQVVWKDKYAKVYASGVMPKVDSVEHYITNYYIEKEVEKIVKKPCRWGLGIQAGYGVMFGNQVQTAPYIGVGISYNILSW